MTSIARHGENPPSPRQLPIERARNAPCSKSWGLASQPPAQAEYGPDAYPSVLRRITSLFLLLALVVFLGVAVAGMIGSVILVAGFLLEQAISG